MTIVRILKNIGRPKYLYWWNTLYACMWLFSFPECRSDQKAHVQAKWKKIPPFLLVWRRSCSLQLRLIAYNFSYHVQPHFIIVNSSKRSDSNKIWPIQNSELFPTAFDFYHGLGLQTETRTVFGKSCVTVWLQSYTRSYAFISYTMKSWFRRSEIISVRLHLRYHPCLRCRSGGLSWSMLRLINPIQIYYPDFCKGLRNKASALSYWSLDVSCDSISSTLKVLKNTKLNERIMKQWTSSLLR